MRISVALAHVLGISEAEIRSRRYDLGPEISLALLLSGGGALPAIALDLWLLRRWLFAPAKPAPSAEDNEDVRRILRMRSSVRSTS